MKLELKEHKVKFEEGGIRQVDIFEAGHYEVVRHFIGRIEDKECYVSYSVCTEEKMMPTIEYWSNVWRDDDKPEFRIQTTAYGALTVDEIKKVVDGYNEALEVVELLTEKFL